MFYVVKLNIISKTFLLFFCAWEFNLYFGTFLVDWNKGPWIEWNFGRFCSAVCKKLKSTKFICRKCRNATTCLRSFCTTSASVLGYLLKIPPYTQADPRYKSPNLTLIFKFGAELSIQAEGRCLWEWSSCKVLINDHRPRRQIYDHGGLQGDVGQCCISSTPV